jgi:hypothetical protein
MSEVIYNVTVNVSEEIHQEWLSWIKEIHIPEVLKTGQFSKATFLRVHALEKGGITYAIQYLAPSMEHYERYLKDYAPKLQAKTQDAYSDQVHSFRTMLEVLDTFEKPAK